MYTSALSLNTTLVVCTLGVRSQKELGMLTLIDKKHVRTVRGVHKWVHWKGLYRCECGKETVVDNGKANRTTKSCGCFRDKKIGALVRGKFGPAHHSFGAKRSTLTDEEKKARINATKAKYRAANKERSKSNELRRQYGISLEQYNDLLLAQDGVCAICKEPEKRQRYSLAVDHCHKTKKVRGLLCRVCNTAIGSLNDDIDRARRMVLYLERYQDSCTSVQDNS